VFANIVIADEINRASPKTQSAMLECMAEGQATIDGQTYQMPTPFIVVATQNPIDMEGTYALPEAQRDRFLTRISLGYPATADEVDLLDNQIQNDPLETADRGDEPRADHAGAHDRPARLGEQGAARVHRGDPPGQPQ
jgi:MoxR-like ATPase